MHYSAKQPSLFYTIPMLNFVTLFGSDTHTMSQPERNFGTHGTCPHHFREEDTRLLAEDPSFHQQYHSPPSTTSSEGSFGLCEISSSPSQACQAEARQPAATPVM